MRIRALGLERYGAFEDRRIEFGSGLTLVVGANEAGKSTTLEALSDLLWTFRGTRQSFHYGLGALSLTADLELPETPPAEAAGSPGSAEATGPAAGTARLEIRRRNAGLQTVADGAAFTSPWGAGGAEERRRWRRAFGLSHAELRDGGARVFEGSGDLAELVFTARSGRAVRGLLDALGAEMDALYKAHRNSRTVKVRTALADYEQRAEQAASSMTRAAHVEDARRELALRHRDAEAAARAARTAAAHRDRLEQRVRAAAHVRALMELRERQAALLAAGPALTADQAAAFDTGTEKITAATAELDRLTAELHDREATRATLTVDERILAEGDAITRLDRVCLARLDDDRRARELADGAGRQSDQARSLLLGLVGPNDERDTAGLLDHLHVPRDVAAQVDALAATITDVSDELRRAEEALTAARRTVAASGGRSRPRPGGGRTDRDRSRGRPGRRDTSRLGGPLGRCRPRRSGPGGRRRRPAGSGGGPPRARGPARRAGAPRRAG
ncbi:AAA family ATPase [Parafrankia sp. FMc2]|uniref:AAA family ATPase n=1 Tax=Parafrankia sp. FMc2 TaxID=3233196 RepID=UPI0034D4E74F